MNSKCLTRRAVLVRMLAVAAVTALLLPGQPASAGQAGWDALKKGTAVAIMRHALAPGTGDPANFDVADCTTQRNLSEQGRKQARETGDLFRAKGIAGAGVFTSQWCRCRETAELLALGAVQTLEPLNSFFRQRDRREAQTTALKEWLQARTADKPLVLVTHQVNITALTGVFPQSGEILFVEMGEEGAVRIVDRAIISP